MQVWKLTPVPSQVNAPQWKNTSHTGSVRIRAHSESRAREIALQMFGEKNVKNAVHATGWSDLPWMNPRLVSCELEEDDISGQEGILDIQ